MESKAQKSELPIDRWESQISANLDLPIVISAEPGVGKTTRIPVWFLNRLKGKILVLEPRRLAAIMSARRVASELGQEAGQDVGYIVRHDSRVGSETRLIFVTEGIFLRLVATDPSLKPYDMIVIDEFHERHLDTDIAISVCQSLRNGPRPDLRLMVMSATLDVDELESALGETSTFKIEGKKYPVEVLYEDPYDQSSRKHRHLERPVHVEKVLKKYESRLKPGESGLVFLPSVGEIRDVERQLKQSLDRSRFEVLPLYADLKREEQERVFAKSDRVKIVLATNVAESSITIDGVTMVIDSGVARLPVHAHWSGFQTLDIKPVSKASCIQRAGRAGRTSPGMAIRLFSEADFYRRQEHSVPEIERSDLSQSLLQVLRVMDALVQSGNSDVQSLLDRFHWFRSPDEKQQSVALELLQSLELIDEKGITELGRKVSRLPLHPRLGVIAVKADESGKAPAGCLVAAFLSEGTLLPRTWHPKDPVKCDIAYQINAAINDHPQVDRRVFKRCKLMYRQLARIFQVKESFDEVQLDNLSSILLFGFHDRVAGLHKGNKSRKTIFNFCQGKGGTLQPSSGVRKSDFILVLGGKEDPSKRGFESVSISLGSQLDKDTLRLLPACSSSVEVDEDSGQSWLVTMYGLLELERQKIESEEDFNLVKALSKHWPSPFKDGASLDIYHGKQAALTQGEEPVELPEFRGEMFELLLEAIADGKSSLKEVMQHDLVEYINFQLSYENQQLLLNRAPDEAEMLNGKTVRLRYEIDGTVRIEAKIQDFYGDCRFKNPFVDKLRPTFNLLAPNGRPAQITSDLHGFFASSYFEVRKELQRRYPKHYWPDEPTRTEPWLLKKHVNQTK